LFVNILSQYGHLKALPAKNTNYTYNCMAETNNIPQACTKHEYLNQSKLLKVKIIHRNVSSISKRRAQL